MRIAGEEGGGEQLLIFIPNSSQEQLSFFLQVGTQIPKTMIIFFANVGEAVSIMLLEELQGGGEVYVFHIIKGGPFRLF